MPWNWELPDWPKFHDDPTQIAYIEKKFLLGVGSSMAYLRTIKDEDRDRFVVEILSLEGIESARIEGEILDRESLQSSIKRQFGMPTLKKKGEQESRMAALLCDIYQSFDEPLTHEMLYGWHSMLFKGSFLSDWGKYRTHLEPMQIVSNRYDSLQVFFEAPPSERVAYDMEVFVKWFNETRTMGSVIERAAITHVYFESIHPFEDGNGRLGRILVEKVLSQGLGQPILIAVSKRLENRKREYYAGLERCNRTLDVQSWVNFFAEVILEAHDPLLVRGL
jgi:Fic family protein